VYRQLKRENDHDLRVGKDFEGCFILVIYLCGILYVMVM